MNGEEVSYFAIIRINLISFMSSILARITNLQVCIHKTIVKTEWTILSLFMTLVGLNGTFYLVVIFSNIA